MNHLEYSSQACLIASEEYILPQLHVTQKSIVYDFVLAAVALTAQITPDDFRLLPFTKSTFGHTVGSAHSRHGRVNLCYTALASVYKRLYTLGQVKFNATEVVYHL